ncbi:MAG: dihydroorotate dehydrogenase-like protein [Rikenellaceae bacterium]|nr:dihydroorotate dehydrogenase-like protein [Rikenellaceae bacterium]
MDLTTNYLGIALDNPLIAASSHLTTTADRIKKLEEAGIGAVVLKSVFEEQIRGEAGFLETFNTYPEAADYLNAYVEQEYMKGHLDLISQLKRETGLPVIASINCVSGGGWTAYAAQVEAAGADALELNIYIMPAGVDATAEEVERQYLAIVAEVAGKVSMPVSVKLNMRFTNVLNLCKQIYYHGGKGVVMFNRPFEPDFDIDTISLAHSTDALSSRSELRNSLRTVGMCTPQLPDLDVAVSTGVHTGGDAVKSILAGAKAVQLCSALGKGFGVICEMKEFMAGWMERHGFSSVEDFRGLLSHNTDSDEELYQRVQYMRFFPNK